MHSKKSKVRKFSSTYDKPLARLNYGGSNHKYHKNPNMKENGNYIKIWETSSSKIP